MHLRFAFVLVVGLLLATSCDAWKKKKGKGSNDNNDPDASSTSVETSVATSPATSEATSAATVSGGSTVSTPTEPTTEAFTGTTVTPGTEPSGATSGAPATGGSTAAPTTGGSTGTAGPTTSAPLPNVTVSLIKFGDAVCDDTACTYQFDAPGNDQAFLATEDSLIATDRTQYGSLQADAQGKDSKIKKANDDAQAKIQQLQTLIDAIQTNLNTIQSNIVLIKANQVDAQKTLQFVEKFVADVNSAPNNCLYLRCLKPTTPAPPTTTPTPSPTTPPSPCLNFTCPGDTAGDQCLLDSTNSPYCTNCQDNYDGYAHCNSIACTASGTNVTLSADGTGTIYSTGYNESSPTDSVIPAGANCRWQLSGQFQVVKDGFSLACLTSKSVTITIWGSDGSKQQLTNSTTMRSINAFLNIVTDPYFVLTSTQSDQSFCQIPVQVKPSGQEEKKPANGFFSWLMGN